MCQSKARYSTRAPTDTQAVVPIGGLPKPIAGHWTACRSEEMTAWVRLEKKACLDQRSRLVSTVEVTAKAGSRRKIADTRV